MTSDDQVKAPAEEALEATDSHAGFDGASTWLYNLHVLWSTRGLLTRVTGIAFVFFNLRVTFNIVLRKPYNPTELKIAPAGR